MKDTIIINGYKYGKGKKSLIGSLFTTGGTNHGYYKEYSKSIHFYNMQDVKIAVLNKGNGVMGKATKLENGKYWYSYGNPEFFEGLEYSEKQVYINNILAS